MKSKSKSKCTKVCCPSNKPKRKTKRIKPEKAIQKEILAWLKAEGHLHWRQNSGMAFIASRMINLGTAGLPDIVVVLAPRGRMLGLEVKSAVGKMRPAQIAFSSRLIAAGGEYAVVRSVEEAKEAIKATLANQWWKIPNVLEPQLTAGKGERESK